MKNVRHYCVGAATVLLISGFMAFLFFKSRNSERAQSASSDVQPGSVAAAREKPAEPLALRTSQSSRRSMPDVTSSGTFPKTARKSVPPTIGRIVNTDGTVSFNERLAAVRFLGTRLSGEEIEGLHDFLLVRNRDSLVKNDILNKLRTQDTLPAGLTDVLAAIYEDQQQDPPLRHYALQHAALGYGKAAVEDKVRIQNLLWSATTEINSGIPGTALLGLKHLAEVDPNVDESKVGEAALSIATNPQANELARITAMRICGELGVRQILSTAMAFSESAQSVSLRMAAIATVGDLGGAAQKELLQRLAMDSEPRVQTAAQSALQRLQQRTNT